MLPPKHKCPPSERKERPDPRSAKRGKFMSYAKKKGLPAPAFAVMKMGKATKYKKYLAGLKAATAGGGKGSGKGGGNDFIKRRMKLAGAGSALGRAAKASKWGKIALGVGAAGVAAQQYLKGKWKKKKGETTTQKKMGGGMMQKPMGYKHGGGYDSGTPGMFRDIASKGGFRPIPTRPKGGPKVIGPDDPRYGRAKKYFEAQEKKKKIKSIGKAIARAAVPGAGAVGIAKKIVSKIKESGSSGKPSKGIGGKTGGKGRPTTTKYDPSRNPNPKTPKLMNIGGSVTVKTKIGKNFPTKTY